MMVKSLPALVINSSDVDNYVACVKDVRIPGAFDSYCLALVIQYAATSESIRVTCVLVCLCESQHIDCESLIAVKSAIVSPNNLESGSSNTE